MKSEVKGKSDFAVKEIKKIKVIPVIKIFALFGLTLGILSFLEYCFVKFMPGFASQLGIDASGLSIWVILGYALVVLASYILVGIVVTLLYNWFAKLVGGIKIVLD